MSIRSGKYIAWVKHCQRHGVPLTTYKCPGCGEQLMTQSSPENEVWDSFTCCPWCSAVFFKQVEGAKVKVSVVIQNQ
ncbi:hypothetical protein FQZ95_12400 [Escherichia sp. HH41S]|nr:hypothetical protein [Escherichia sp. HH41S]